jgi:hypothetical protein
MWESILSIAHWNQIYKFEFVSDLRHIDVFFTYSPVSSTNKTDRHDITEILFKVALNTINQTKPTNLKLHIFNFSSKELTGVSTLALNFKQIS